MAPEHLLHPECEWKQGESGGSKKNLPNKNKKEGN
jgi:hypothetical protein